MKRRNKGLTLAEVLITVLIVGLAAGAIAFAYPVIFDGVNICSQKVRAWGFAQREIERLKNLKFTALLDDANEGAKEVGDLPEDFLGVYYIDWVEGDLGQLDGIPEILDDLLEIKVVIWFRAGRRVIGEDQNFNGVLDGGEGEDIDSDDRFDSPVELRTLVCKR